MIDLEDSAPETDAEPRHAGLARRALAGDFSGENLAEMVEGVPNGKGLFLAGLLECLGARKWYWDKATNSVHWEPDYRTRLDAVKVGAAYIWGVPTKTAIVANLNMPGGNGQPGGDMTVDLSAELDRSPALRERLTAMLGGQVAAPVPRKAKRVKAEAQKP